MYCNKCGKPIPEGSTFCNVCGSPQGKIVQTPTKQTVKLPTYYYAISWVLFGICMAYGVARGIIGFFSGDEVGVYKGMIACGAACMFIPQITVGTNKPAVILSLKIIVALAVMIFI